MTNSTFGQRLRTAMRVTGTRNKKLASHLGVGPSMVSHLCADQRSPSFDTLAAILTAMPTVDARWLVLGEGHD